MGRQIPDECGAGLGDEFATPTDSKTFQTKLLLKHWSFIKRFEVLNVLRLENNVNLASEYLFWKLHISFLDVWDGFGADS